jgi:EAL domain-containing protein (putative c-di-GMP-specific phosphodiesterase class I)
MDRAADFRALLAPGAIRAVFQPIVRLADLSTIGYEGLARFPTPPGLIALPPDVILAAAARSGLRDDLEVACWSAIAGAGVPPEGRMLWVNLSPEALAHPGLLEVAGRLPERLVIELTEQDAVLNHALLRERLRPWIARGALVAVDDAGAGFTSLEYVADIRPDFLKLARGLVAGVDGDASREAVLRATAAFAREVGARVVAEGVERVEELEVLRDIEIEYGQGWLFGRPSAPWPQDIAPGFVASTPAPARPAPAAPADASAERLERALGRTGDTAAACEAAADHLARRGLLPAVYLAQGGTLRCQAARGYWQVRDGVPASGGDVGQAFAGGETVVVDDASVPGAHARACLPLGAAGVLVAETLVPLDAATLAELERTAAALSARLEEVGVLGHASPAQRLARTAARLAGTDAPAEIVRETLAAALELSGCESGLVALANGYGELYPRLAEGTFGIAFSQLSAEELGDMVAWVRDGTSCYTLGDTAGRGYAGHEVLRKAGAASLIVLPLVAGGQRLGLIVLADRANRRPPAEDVELLELLAHVAAGGLRPRCPSGDAPAAAQRTNVNSRSPVTSGVAGPA